MSVAELLMAASGLRSSWASMARNSSLRTVRLRQRRRVSLQFGDEREAFRRQPLQIQALRFDLASQDPLIDRRPHDLVESISIEALDQVVVDTLLHGLRPPPLHCRDP